MNFSEYTRYTLDAVSSVDDAAIDRTIASIIDAQRNRRSIFVIGNGGSAANASHLAQDLAKGTTADHPTLEPIRAVALTDNVAWITALANDEGYEQVFVRQLSTLARPGDLLVAISGSGTSRNIVEAARFANENQIELIGVTGFSGGDLRRMSDISLHVELDDMCTSESVHSVLFHYIVLELMRRLPDDGVHRSQ